MRAALYIRVSTNEQATEGVSLEAQEARLRAYCTMRGLEVAEVVTDAGVSAGKALDAREGGRRVLELIASGEADAVVAYKLDRLFRDCADCLTVTRTWDRTGVALHLVDMGGQTLDTSTAMGRFFLTVMAGAAELERGLVGERTKVALAHKRSKGEKTGGRVPYGWQLATDGKTLEPNHPEQAVMGCALELRDAGLSLRAVAADLEARGLLNRAGRRFSAKGVSTVLAARVA